MQNSILLVTNAKEEFDGLSDAQCDQDQLTIERTVATMKTTDNNGHFMIVHNEKTNKNTKRNKETTNIFLIVSDLIGFKENRSISGNGTLILLGVMLLLFLISVTGFCVMWFTEYYNNTMLSNIILAENSETAQHWINPNPKYDTLLKVHIFNYTNIDRYLAGLDDKIQVDDIGPLTYQEHTIKVGVSFNENFTVTFRDHRSYKFLPEKSKYSQFEKIVVPNVPLLSADVKVEKLFALKKIFAVSTIRSFREPVFKTLKAHEFLWGYPDRIVRLDIGTGDDRFGLLMNRNGTSVDSLQINTGEDDIRKFSFIRQFNGMPSLDYWSDEMCNSINGSDPSMFPPHIVENREKLFVFLQVLCRKVPLVFEKEVVILNNINALRYRTPLNVFAHPDINPDNACYCQNTETCFLSGVINATKCYNGAPIYPSFPHFFSGDPKLYENFDGISPDANKHQTYADIHPRFGFPISGASRIQINIAINKGQLVHDKIPRISKGTILPLLWIEITSGDLSDDIIDKLYVSTFGLNAIQFALKYGTLLICVTSFGLIVGVFYTLSQKREKKQDIVDDNNIGMNMETLASNFYPPIPVSKT